jgi:hypothetical protein
MCLLATMKIHLPAFVSDLRGSRSLFSSPSREEEDLTLTPFLSRKAGEGVREANKTEDY